MENKNNSVGAIWTKENQYGQYLSISVEIEGVKHTFIAFPNKYKQEGSQQPDYKILTPKSKSEQPQI